MLTHDKSLELAREDYARQETYRESLFQRTQFLVTASTLLIASNLSLLSYTPQGWKWWLLAALSLPAWYFLLRLFRLIWLMYYGNEYKDTKTMQSYLDWQQDRRRQLEETGLAEAERISGEEVMKFLVEDYAFAAHSNREVNLAIQSRMTEATRIVLWMTLAIIVEATLFVVLVALGI